MQNNQRWITVSYVGLSLVAWFFVRQLAGTIWGLARLPVPQDFPATPADLIALAVAITLFVILKRHPRVNEFANDVALELGKVTWPPKRETVLSAGVVSVMIGICSLLLFAFDTLWGTVVKLLYQ